MKLDVNKIAFALALAVAGVLVALGKLPASALTVLVAWLAPSPASAVK